MPRDTPAAPTTQAGREFLADFEAHPDDLADLYLPAILAIEAEARSTPAEALDVELAPNNTITVNGQKLPDWVHLTIERRAIERRARLRSPESDDA
jgi:hypothetical protein